MELSRGEFSREIVQVEIVWMEIFWSGWSCHKLFGREVMQTNIFHEGTL